MIDLFKVSDGLLQAESLEDTSVPHSNIHGIFTMMEVLKNKRDSNDSSSSNSVNIINNEPSIPTINGYSGNEIIHYNSQSCDFACMYLDHKMVETNTDEKQMIIRLWDGTTIGTTTNVDPKILNYSLKCALKYAEGNNTLPLNSKTEEIKRILQQECPNDATELMGCPLIVMVTDDIVVDMLSVGLLPGTWLRIRNLHLPDSGIIPSIQNDTSVCSLKPFFRLYIH